MTNALREELIKYTAWGDATETTTSRLIEEMIQTGRVSREDVDNGDVEKVRDAILAVTARDVNIDYIAQGELADMLKGIQYARRVRVGMVRNDRSGVYAEVRQAAIQKGQKRDYEYIASSEHEFKDNGVDEKANVVQDLFRGNFGVFQKFTDLMMVKFVTTATNRTTRAFIKKYKKDIENLENYLNRGFNEKGEIASQAELTELKEKIKNINDKIKILQEEGWLGASRIPEVTDYTFRKIAIYIEDACKVSKFILENKDKYNYDLELLLKACKEYLNSPTDIDQLYSWDFACFDSKIHCLSKLTRIDESSGLSKEEIAKHNDAAMDYRYFLFDEMCRKLTAISDASFSVRMVQRKKDKDKQTRKDNEDETEEKTNDIRNREDEDGNENATNDNELSEEEESEREIQFVSNKQRSVTSSLSQKVKSVLGSLWEYRYDEGSKSFGFVLDERFGFKRLVPKGHAFMFLLRRLNQANNGKGLRNGDEVYEWLKNHEKYIPWLHGIVVAMDEDPYLKTQFYVAFKKSYQRFRVTKPTDPNKWGQVSEEEKESESSYKDKLTKHGQTSDVEGKQMYNEIQDQVASGVLLTTGKVAVGNDIAKTIALSTGFKRFRTIFEFEDISIYDRDGNISKGELIDLRTGKKLTFDDAKAYLEKVEEEEGKKFNYKYDYARRKGNYREFILAKATGYKGFRFFVETRLNRKLFEFDPSKNNTSQDEENKANNLYYDNDGDCNSYSPVTYQQTLDERRPVLNDLLTALHALGLSLTMDELIGACEGRGEKLERIVNRVHNIKWIIDSDNPKVDYSGKPVFEVLRKVYGYLASEMSILNKNNIEDNTRWHDKNYYCYGQRSFVNELVDELGDDENDEEWAEYVNEHYYLCKKDAKTEKDVNSFINKPLRSPWEKNAEAAPKNRRTSFFYDANALKDGDSFDVLNGILRDMDPDYEENEYNTWRGKKFKKPKYKYQNYRRAFRDCDINLGMDVQGWNYTKSVEYDKLTVAQKVMLEMSYFYNPLYKKYIALRDCEEGTPNIVKYALPIASDSNNHIFVGARAFLDFDSGSYVNESISSYKKDGLLDRAADVVFSEFNRINCFSSNSVDGKPIPRPDLPKNFKKKMLEFCAYPELNDMQVAFGNKEQGFGAPMSLYDAMATFLSEGKDGQDFQLIINLDNGEVKTINHKAGSRTNARELALTAVNFLLNDYFRKDMDFWQEEGVFEYDDVKKEFKNLSTAEFKDAAKQYARRSKYAKEILNDNSERGRQLKDQLRQNGVYDFLVSFTDIRMGEVLYGADEEAKQRYIDAVEGTENKQGYRKTLYNILAPLVDTEKLEEEKFDNSWKGGSKATDDKYYNVLKLLGYFYDKERSTWYYKDYREDKERLYKKIGDKYIKDLSESIEVKAEKPKTSNFNILNNNFVHLMHVYAMNKMSFKSQMTGLLVGDLAQFKNATDFTKRSKAFVAASERCDLTAVDKYHNNRRVVEYYGDKKIEEQEWIKNQKTITISDFEAKANNDGTIGGFYGISQFFNEQLLPMLRRDRDAGVISEQEFIDYCSGYQGMNVSDGQSFRTLESMYKLMMMLGLGSEQLSKIYETVMSGGKLSFYEIQDYFAQMKTVAYDEQEVPIEYSVTLPDGTQETRVYMQKFGDFIKDSQFTLMMYTTEMSEYLGKDSVLEGVLRFARKNQIDVVHFPSTKKFGEFNTVSVTECKNGTEAEAKLQAAYDAGIDENGKGNAKDIRHKESWRRIGRQLPTKEHLVDKEQGIGTQLDKLILADMPDSWWHFSINDPETKEESPTYVKLFNEANQILAKYTVEEFRNLVNTIKILNMREDLKQLEENFDTKEKLSQMLISAVDGTSKYADNVREALKINPETGDFNIPLDHPVIFDAIQTVIASAVRKHVIKQRTAGGTAIQFSSVGRTDALKTVYEVDPESGQNRIKYVEALLPAWSKDLFRKFAKPDGTLDINDIPVELRTMIGYRIPTEHLYSAVPIRVVGFLDSSQGASIMLPQEIVVWSGSDFDIDKIFLMRQEFKVDKDGNIDMGEKLNSDHPTFEELKNASRLERNNLLVKLYNARLTSDFSCRDLARPGGFAAQKKMARIMNILKNQKSRLKEGERVFTLEELQSRQLEDTYDDNGNLIEGLDTLAEKYGKRMSVLQGSFDDQIFKLTMTGSSMISIYALHNAFHAVIQTAKIMLSDAFVKMCGFTINGNGMRTTLGEVFDEFGNSILRNIGGFFAASVDNAKDPVLAELAQNPLTADLSLAFLHMGYSIETTCLLMNQPIVQRFMRENRDASSFTINGRLRSFCKSLKIKQMEANLDNATLAAAITEGENDGMEKDKVQRSVMYALNTMTYVSDSIRSIMNEIKITSPKDNMANTLGDTLERMRPAEIASEKNKFSVKSKEGTINYPVFNAEQFNNLLIPNFDRGENEPMDADVYMNGYEVNGQRIKPRLPYVQMCYDAGFVRIQNLMKRHIPSLSSAMIAGIDKLKKFSYQPNPLIEAAIVNAFVNEYKIYQAMNFAFKEDVQEGIPISQMRRAYLLSFPKYYRGILSIYSLKEGKEKRDLRSEFSILSSLKVEKSSEVKMDILWMSSSGVRVTNRQLNEHVASWERMAKDKDPVIRNLAIQLYKYSVYYNGCTRELHGFGRFAPASILKEYEEYNDFLRKSADIGIPDRYFDQFVRNHVGELSSSIIRDISLSSSDLRTSAFFEISQVEKKDYETNKDGVTKEVIKKSASYHPKDVVPASAAGEAKGSYIRVTSPNNSRALYRRQQTADGDMFVRCGKLGYKLFREYDPFEELDWSVGFSDDAYLTEENLQDALLENQGKIQAAIKRNSETLAMKVAKQNEIFDKIKEDDIAAQAFDVENYLEALLFKEGTWQNVTTDNGINLFMRLQAITRSLFSDTLNDVVHEGFFKYAQGKVYDPPTSLKGYLNFHGSFKSVNLNRNNKKTITDILVRDQVTTSSSESMNVAAELTYLSKNSDGSFSIAMPVFVPQDKYDAFAKATVGNGVNGKTDLSNVRESNEAYLAATYMYSLKRMLVNKYPDIDISDMMLVPISAYFVEITKKDGTQTRNLEEYEKGDDIYVNTPWPCLEKYRKMDRGVLHLPLDGDSIIVSKPQETAKTTAAVPSAPTGNAVTYREIFEKFLDEKELSNKTINKIINKLDGIYTEEDINRYKDLFGEKWEDQLIETKNGGFYRGQMEVLPDKRNNPMGKKNIELTLARQHINDSVIEKLVEAIQNNHDIKGDDGVSLCRI